MSSAVYLQVKSNPMTNTNEQPLAILADPALVSDMLAEVAYNRPEIQNFLEMVGHQTAFMFAAWYVGQMAFNNPDTLKDFAKALECSVQLAGIMRAQWDIDNPGAKNIDDILLLYPASPSNEEQLSIGDATGSSLIQ